jgi:hypothetical protein
LVVLASLKSRAYDFKNKALYQIYGKQHDDLVAEDLRFVDYCGSATTKTADSLFNLSELIEEWENSDSLRIVNWLQYFLRSPLMQNVVKANEIIEMLRTFIQLRRSLPEEYSKTNAEEDYILPHKTQIWVF